jgi:hypothetical protein
MKNQSKIYRENIYQVPVAATHVQYVAQQAEETTSGVDYLHSAHPSSQ